MKNQEYILFKKENTRFLKKNPDVNMKDYRSAVQLKWPSVL